MIVVRLDSPRALAGLRLEAMIWTACPRAPSAQIWESSLSNVYVADLFVNAVPVKRQCSEDTYNSAEDVHLLDVDFDKL